MASRLSLRRDVWPRVALLLGAILAGCIEPRPVQLEVPARVEWVALIDGTRASALVRWVPGQPLPAHTTGGQTVQILGYTAEQVRALPVREGASISEEHLQLARGCDRRLPVPAWFGELTPEDVLSERAPSEAPTLTASWISCPMGPLLTHPTCLSLPCPIGESRTDGCTVRVDLSACQAGVLTGERQADGSVCFESLPWSCEPAAPTAPEITAQLCADGCRTSVFESPREAPFTLARIAVTGGDLYLPGELTGDLRVPSNRLHSGKAFDVALLRGRAVVTHAGGRAVRFCPEEAPEGTLSFYDLDSLAPVGTASAPECLTRLLSEGDTFVGVHGVRGAPVLSRFDGVGKRLASGAPEGAGGPRPDASTHVIGGMTLMGSPPRLTVLYEWVEAREGGVDLGYFLSRHDLASLASVHTDLIRDGRAFAMVAVGTSTLAIADEKHQRIDYFDVDRRVFVGATPLPTSRVARRYDVTAVARAPGTGRLLSTTPLELSSVRLVDDLESIALVLPFERTFFPTSATAWPGAPDVLAVAGVSPGAAGQYDAVVTLFDTRNARFLPGTWTIGAGAVTRMVVDDSGRVWALLPWAGDLVRLTPR